MSWRCDWGSEPVVARVMSVPLCSPGVVWTSSFLSEAELVLMSAMTSPLSGGELVVVLAVVSTSTPALSEGELVVVLVVVLTSPPALVVVLLWPSQWC